MNKGIITALASLVIFVFSASIADARPRQAAPPASGPFCWEPAICAQPGVQVARRAADRTELARSRVAGAILPHPEGCPRRAFCGCGASVKVWGHPVRSLYLAVAWLSRFPHVPKSMAQPGHAAARRGHVFVLEQHVSGDDWIVYDANSGGHATRRHVRSIRGYTVVNPRA